MIVDTLILAVVLAIAAITIAAALIIGWACAVTRDEARGDPPVPAPAGCPKEVNHG